MVLGRFLGGNKEAAAPAPSVADASESEPAGFNGDNYGASRSSASTVNSSQSAQSAGGTSSSMSSSAPASQPPPFSAAAGLDANSNNGGPPSTPNNKPTFSFTSNNNDDNSNGGDGSSSSSNKKMKRNGQAVAGSGPQQPPGRGIFQFTSNTATTASPQGGSNSTSPLSNSESGKTNGNHPMTSAVSSQFSAGAGGVTAAAAAGGGSSAGKSIPMSPSNAQSSCSADNTPSQPKSPCHATATSSSSAWTPQTHTTTCEFTHLIENYSQKRDSGCKKAEYSQITTDSHGNKWRLIIYVNGNGRASNHHLSLFLQVADAESLPFGWNKAVSYVLTLEHPDGNGNDNSSSSSSTNNNNNNSSSPQHQQQQNMGYSKRNPDKTFKMCPKAIDWGWSQFITSDRIQQEGYVRNDDALVVRASVTVKSSSVTIDPEDAELYLKCAVEEGNADAVRVCLKQNARVNCQFKDDLYTPLHTACSATGDGGQSSSSNSSAASSISNGDGNNNNGKSNANDNSPGPVSPGNLEVLNLLLEMGADVNACNKWRETPLLIAANNGHVEAVKALLKSGADPSLCSEAGWSALTFAAHKGYSDIVRLLLAAQAPVNCRVTEDLSTPLHKACAGSKPGHLSAVTQLLGGNADVHALNKWRETPLLTAANHGQDKAVGELLRYGADPCKCTDTGWSPLSIAAYKGHDEVVRLLLEEGAPTEEDDPTLSALLQAATKGLPDTCILLLRHGADHTVTTKKGDTALAILVEQDMIDAAVEMVTDYNASIPRCSRDRKKVQRARLLINLRLKQHKREGTGPYADDDFSDGGESDDAEESGSAVALHDAAIPQTTNETLVAPKSKKKKGKKSIAKAEEDARAAEEALLLELEAEENAKSETSKSSKKKKKKKDRERQLKAEKAKEEEIQKAAAAAAAAEKAAKAKEEAAAKAKKERVIELTSASQPIASKSEPKSKKKDSSSTAKKSNRNKEVSLPTPSSLPTQTKKQADAKLNLKWAEGKDGKTKKAGESLVAKSETAKKSIATLKKTITPKKIPGDNPISKIPGDNPLPKRIPGDNPIQPKKIPGDNPKVPMQQSRVISTPKPVAKAAATPKNKRGWESKASTPSDGAGQNVQQVAKGRAKDNSSNKETRKGGQSSKSPSVTPDSLNESKIKVRSDETTYSTENSTTDSLPVTPNPTQRSNTQSRVSVDEELASMANDVLGFLDFGSQPRQSSSDAESNSVRSDSYHGTSGFDAQTPPPNLNTTATFVTSPPAIPPLVSSISVELPPVSVFRLEKLHELFRQCSDARSSPNNHPLSVIDERTLRTVLYRWIIRASHGSDSFLDPVIPSWEDEAYLKEYLQRQFISESRRAVDDTRYNVNVPSIEVLRDAGASMSELCFSLAKEVVEFRSKCEQQVPPNWTDSNINVAGMEDGNNVVVDWSGKSRLSIPLSLFNSLVRRHVGQQNRLMSAVFSAVRRHEIIAAIADQTEMVCHLPPQSVDFLTKGLNASLETFSDSVSVRGNNYFCAMFPDVDAAFGGLSPFGKDSGSVESMLTRSGASVIVVAPPENNASSQCCRTIVDMVESHANVPLSFGVVLSSDCFVNATRTLSADHLRALDPRLCGDQNGFISFIEVIPAGSCNFSKSSSMFLLIQNEAGKRHFPLNTSSIEVIRRSLRSDVSMSSNNVSAMPSLHGAMQNEPVYDASAYSPRSPVAPQPQFASVSQEMAFPSNPWESAPASGRRGGGHRGRLFELVDGEEGEDDQGMSTVLPGMLNNLNMDMFGGSTNSGDDIDIEAISLMGIGMNANLGERFSK